MNQEYQQRKWAKWKCSQQHLKPEIKRVFCPSLLLPAVPITCVSTFIYRPVTRNSGEKCVWNRGFVDLMLSLLGLLPISVVTLKTVCLFVCFKSIPHSLINVQPNYIILILVLLVVYWIFLFLGLNRLLTNGSYEAAFPLHEVSFHFIFLSRPSLNPKLLLPLLPSVALILTFRDLGGNWVYSSWDKWNPLYIMNIVLHNKSSGLMPGNVSKGMLSGVFFRDLEV